MTNNSISLNLICQNEEQMIGQTVRWLKKLMNSIEGPTELIIVDGGSTDSTLDIINSEKDERFKIFHNPWPGFWAQRNFAIEKSQFNWIYWTDSDALACDCLFKDINQLVKTDRYLIYSFPKFHLASDIYHIYNTGPDPLIGLFRNIPEIRFKKSHLGLEDFYYNNDVIFGADFKYSWQRLHNNVWAIHFESLKSIDLLLTKYRKYAAVPGNPHYGKTDEVIRWSMRTQERPHVIPISERFKNISFYHEVEHAFE